MSTAKDQIKQIFENQPDDSSYDEILKELAFSIKGSQMLTMGIQYVMKQ